MADNVSIPEQFETAVTLVQSLPKKGPYQPSYSDAGKVYSYYKQSKFGPCTDTRPGFWDVINRAKWDAWSALGDMPQETAMLNYIEEVKRIYEQVRSNEEFAQREYEFADSIIPFCLSVNVPLSPSLEKYAEKYRKTNSNDTEKETNLKTDQEHREHIYIDENEDSIDESNSSTEKITDNVLVDFEPDQVNQTSNVDDSIGSNDHLDEDNQNIRKEETNEKQEESSDEEEEIYCDSLTDQANINMSVADIATNDVKEISSSEDIVENMEVINESTFIKSICKSNSSSEESKSEFEIVEKFSSNKPKTVRYAADTTADVNKKVGDTNKMKAKKVPPSNVLVSVPKSYARRLVQKSRLAKVPLTQPASYATLDPNTQVESRYSFNEDISNESDSSLDMASTNTPDDIALKIVKSLSRIEIVLQQVAQRLETVNKNMERRNELISSRYWWQKYLPSKFHLFAIAWPILLNLILYIYWRKRRRRRLIKTGGST